MSFAGDEEDKTEETEIWLNSIDRGGLWHVNDTMYICIFHYCGRDNTAIFHHSPHR